MHHWYNHQNPVDLWKNTRGFGHHKSILMRLHYKPADPGIPTSSIRCKNLVLSNDSYFSYSSSKTWLNFLGSTRTVFPLNLCHSRVQRHVLLKS